jgi:hypothetical protein
MRRGIVGRVSGNVKERGEALAPAAGKGHGLLQLRESRGKEQGKVK